jgi:hypothetical protein
VGDILNSIFGFLGDGLLSALEDFIVWVYQLAIAVFQVLWQIIGFVAQTILNVIKAVGGFLDRLWKGFFQGIFTKVWNAIKAASTWLEAKLSPIVKYLQKVRAYYLKWFNTYIKPFLQLIQQVRQYLQILSFLHLGFAQKLDAWLAQLQAKIVQSFATIIGTINTAIDILNAIMDPAYLIRKPALLLSIRRQIPALVRVLTGRPPGYFFGAPGVSSSSPFSLPKFPLNLTDPSQNPLASTLLGTDDGIGDTSGFFSDFQFGDGAADQTSPLPIFDDSLFPTSPCTNPDQCLLTATVALTTA